MKSPHALPAACAVALLLLLTSAPIVRGTPRVATDRPDYAPGNTVVVNGSGWAAGEVVTLTFTRAPAWPAPRVLTATADESGGFSNGDLTLTYDDKGAIFTLLAIGHDPGLALQATFAVSEVGARTVMIADRSVYEPGDTVGISGGGFQPGEAVVLRVSHPDSAGGAGIVHDPWTASADSRGAFRTSWLLQQPDCAGRTLTATATGQASFTNAKTTWSVLAPDVDAEVSVYPWLGVAPGAVQGGGPANGTLYIAVSGQISSSVTSSNPSTVKIPTLYHFIGGSTYPGMDGYGPSSGYGWYSAGVGCTYLHCPPYNTSVCEVNSRYFPAWVTVSVEADRDTPAGVYTVNVPSITQNVAWLGCGYGLADQSPNPVAFYVFLAPPTGLAALALSQSEIRLAWTDQSTGEDGFRIETSADGVTFTTLDTVPANATSYVHGGLPSGSAHHYRVYAYASGNAGLNSTYSGVAQATTGISCVALTVGPASLAPAMVGEAYSHALSANGGSAPYTFALVDGALPDGLHLAVDGTVTGTPTTAGTRAFTVVATDAVGCLGSLNASVDVAPALQVTTASPLPDGIVGTMYSQTISATGGTPPYAFSCADAPGWLTISASGSARGLPGVSGAFTFHARVTDHLGRTAGAALTLTIDPLPVTTLLAGASAVAITPVHPCETLPVLLSRPVGTAVRAYSVRVQLSPELRLCTPVTGGGNGSFTEGEFLSSFAGGTVFHVVDNLDGSYQVDCALLGLPCGPTALTGTLFTVGVTSTSGTACEGSVAVVNPTGTTRLRDCSNDELPVVLGAVGTVPIDLAGPVISGLPSGLVVNTGPGAAACAAPASWPAPSASDACGGAVTLTCDHAPGSSFPVGSTPVTCTATDARGNLSTSVFTVTVVDNTPPTIAAPAAVVVPADPGACSAAKAGVTLGAPTTSDNCGMGSVANDAPAQFPAGTTTVTWTATDVHGNSASAAQLVTVTDTQPPWVALTSPNGGESWTCGTLQNITWTPASDNCGVTAVDLGFSLDGGASYTPVASGVPNSGSYAWTLPASTGSNVRVRITARDASGNETTASSASSFALVGLPVVPDLGAGPATSGNGSDGTLKMHLSWGATPPGTTVEIYRRGYGNYPAYDGGDPPMPTSYPPDGWTLAKAVTGATSADDQVPWPGRDYFYYVAYVRAGGAVSDPTLLDAGVLNYLLGDVSNGAVEGHGNNVVDIQDLSLLGDHYGASGPEADAHACLDVGPTTTGWVDGRPVPDHAIEFEDLVIFTLNYGQHFVKPGTRLLPASSRAANRTAAATVRGPAEALVVERPERVSAGSTAVARLKLSGTGALRAVSIRLAWDPAVVEPAGFEAGEWLAGNRGVAFSPKPGRVDVAALQDRTFAGAGLLATVTFRSLAAGDPGIRVDAVDGRDAGNYRLAVSTSEQLDVVVPAQTRLAPASPNPFRNTSTLGFSLSRTGRVELSIFAIGGRRVRTLVSEARGPGEYREIWDGRDDAGRPVPAGVYYAHLQAGTAGFTRKVLYLK